MPELVPPLATILVVDDTPGNIDVLREILAPAYRVKVATSGVRALEIAAQEEPPDLILLDIMMPDLDGYEVIRRLKADPLTRGIPVLFITAKEAPEDEQKGFDLGCVDYITKPISAPRVRARVRTQLALHDQNRALEGAVRDRTRELQETRLEIIQRLGRAAEYRDNETGLHVIRMSHASQIIALELGLPALEAEILLHAAPMHDIGKIGIPDRVLLKPGKLDAEEWAIMRRHPEIGFGIIGNHTSRLLKMAAQVALTHHERWAGGGYPHDLRGEAIPLAGRIVAVADVFDALTSVRPYKPAWSVEAAVAEVIRGSGSHFEPRVVEAFLARLTDILAVTAAFED
ncbi:MAG: response regulator [Holophaga sp.]|nr:response regulator [Holophaga sp.]